MRRANPCVVERRDRLAGDRARKIEGLGFFFVDGRQACKVRSAALGMGYGLKLTCWPVY